MILCKHLKAMRNRTCCTHTSICSSSTPHRAEHAAVPALHSMHCLLRIACAATFCVVSHVKQTTAPYIDSKALKQRHMDSKRA